MPPKRAQRGKDAPATKDDFRSLAELWEVAKKGGIEWALQTLSQGAGASTHQDAPWAKRLRRTPERFKDAQPDKGNKSLDSQAITSGEAGVMGQPSRALDTGQATSTAVQASHSPIVQPGGPSTQAVEAPTLTNATQPLGPPMAM